MAFRILLTSFLVMFAGLASASYNQGDITNLNNAEPPAKNSRDAGYKTGMAKCVFDPSATSTERTVAAHGCGLTLPNDAIITGAWYKVLTTFVSSGDSATIAIHVEGANDLLSAAAISTGTALDASTALELIPKIETVASWIETDSAAEVTFTVAVEVLTAGKMVVWIQYLYYGDA